MQFSPLVSLSRQLCRATLRLLAACAVLIVFGLIWSFRLAPDFFYSTPCYLFAATIALLFTVYLDVLRQTMGFIPAAFYTLWEGNDLCDDGSPLPGYEPLPDNQLQQRFRVQLPQLLGAAAVFSGCGLFLMTGCRSIYFFVLCLSEPAWVPVRLASSGLTPSAFALAFATDAATDTLRVHGVRLLLLALAGLVLSLLIHSTSRYTLFCWLTSVPVAGTLFMTWLLEFAFVTPVEEGFLPAACALGDTLLAALPLLITLPLWCSALPRELFPGLFEVTEEDNENDSGADR